MDFFLNRAHLAHFRDSKDWQSHRKNILKKLLQILNELNIKYFFDGETYQDLVRNVDCKNTVYLDKIIINVKQKSVLFENFDLIHEKGFKSIHEKNNELFLLNSKRIINIKYRRLPFILKLSSHSFLLNNKDLKKNNNLIKKVYFYRNTKLNSKFLIKKLSNIFKLNSKKKSFSYQKIELNDFLKLNIESKDSINWILRKTHLDIVTKNKTYVKVQDILNYLKKPGQLEKLINDICEVDTSAIFDEPIHLNRSFWSSGNNFFIYPVLFGFKMNVVPYKNANNYIEKKIKPNLYSKEYFMKLENMDRSQIAELFEKSPIEVTNGSVTSGRHRVFAMIGRLIEGKEYIPIQSKLIVD